MVDGTRSALTGWALGSFHAAVLVTALVIVGYWTGVLGDLLAGLRTSIGLAAYLYLWIVTTLTARRWIDELGSDGVAEAERSRLLLAGSRWGAVTGLAVLLGVLVPGGGALLISAGLEAIPLLLVVAGVGTVVSAVVGGVIGAGFALIDRGMVTVSRWVVSPAERV